MDTSLPWRTRLRTLGALVLLPFAPVITVAAGTLILFVLLLLYGAVDPDFDLSEPFTIPFLFVVALGFAVLLQFRSLWRGFRRGLRSPLASLPTREPDEELTSTVQRLAVQAGVDRPRLRVVESETPEAFTVRDGDGRPTIAVSEELLDALEPAGVRAVLAHEVAHLQSRDVTVMRWATLPLAAADEMGRIVDRRFEDGDWPVASVVMEHLLRGYGAACAGIVSVGREYGADAGAAAITGEPAALASALATLDETVASIPRRDLRERSDVVALNVVPATGRGLLSTHPPTRKRIERLRSMATDARAAAES